MNLDQLKIALAKAEDALKTAKHTTVESRVKLETTKMQAGKFTRQTAKEKADLLLKEQAQDQAKAEAQAAVAAIKSQIADAEEKEQQAKQKENALSSKIQVMEEENKDSKTSKDNMDAEVFTKEKQLEALKKKEAVLKAFLAGPLLSVDEEEGAGSTAFGVSSEAGNGSEEDGAEAGNDSEASAGALMESSDLPADLPPL